MNFQSFVVLALVLELGAALQCYVSSFSEVDNQMTYSNSDPVNCNGFCFSRYMNDGWYTKYELGCDTTGFCQAAGCSDDVGTATKTCCCKDKDLCVDPNASSPVMYDISNISLASATAAYQVEGAAFQDGRGASIWDIYVRRPNVIKENDTGDDACKSYEFWETDVQLLKNLGVDSYRFSISWTRILPNGFYNGSKESTNPLGVAYYHKLINTLKAANIEPVVTMYHWDLPQGLMDAGGWLNRDTATAFGKYCDFLFSEYGKDVKKWIPINEPSSIIEFEYCGDTHADAPGNFIPHCAWSLYLAIRNILLGHLEASKAYAKYDGTENGGGQLGIALNGPWYFPATDNQEDKAASTRAFDYTWGVFTNPLFGKGGWPDSIQQRIDMLSKSEKRSYSRLPTFTADEIAGLRKSAQFMGINYYEASMVSSILNIVPDASSPKRWDYNQEDYDSGTHGFPKDSWRQMHASNPWIYYTPAGLRELLKYMKSQYGDVPIIITENGCMDNDGEDLEDNTRVHYLRGHLIAISQAKVVDKVNVVGYTVWSLMDNFEWLDGYTTKFGLHRVDFSDPNRKRTPKKSAGEFTKWIKNRKVDGFTTNSRY